MGNEISRRNSTHVGEVNFTPQFMNNQVPLKFHSVHGENINISRNFSVASRDDGFCKAIVFSHRPVAINEYVYIRFLAISGSWSGGLRIGFTANDPITYQNRLPKYACPCMTDMPGNWARAVAERCVKKDSILFYYVNQKGDVHYGLNDEEHGVFFNGVNTSGKLWAMMDLYGNAIRIELISDNNFRHYLRNRRTSSQDTGAEGAVARPAILPSSTYSLDILSPLSFHVQHGRDVLLCRNRTVAAKNSSASDHGYVFLEQPIKINDYMVLRILQCSNSADGEIIIGLTSCNPSSIQVSELPDCPDELLDLHEYWVIHRMSDHFKNGDILLFVVCNDGCVKFSKNGNQFSTLFFVDQTLSLWFLTTLSKHITEVLLEGSHNVSFDTEAFNCITSLKQSSRSLSVSLPTMENQIHSISSNPKEPENSGECVICYEAAIDTALYRCGHVCMCYTCATQVHRSPTAQCPICREDIMDVIKIYK